MGERVELKGVQDLKLLPKAIEIETLRQKSIIDSGGKIKGEVRKVNKNGTSVYLRPLPGPSRLYPETDCMPIRIDKDYVNNLKNDLPKLLSKRVEEFENRYNLPKYLAKEMIYDEDFEEFVAQFNNLKPTIVAQILLETPKEINTRFGLDDSILVMEDFKDVLSYLNDERIVREDVINILIKKIKGESINLRQDKDLEKNIKNDIKKVLQEKPNLPINGYMGLLMNIYKGRISGRKIRELLENELK